MRLSLPKVSCVLPTGYGEKYVRTAIKCYLDQTYHDGADLELVVVDNNSTPIEHLLVGVSGVKYVRSTCKKVAALRNIGTEAATGQICITWDEDDWYHPRRVEEQVARLLESRKQVTGWHSILYWDSDAEKGFRYLYEPSGRSHPPYAMGTSQCYWKSWWEGHKFPEGDLVEDVGFSNAALHAKQLDSCDAGRLCVATVHRQNVCPKKSALGLSQFPAVERSEFPQEFFNAIGVEKQYIGATE